MADDYEEERLDEEQEGGPVKSFLEHLEDLRWVLIKSGVAVGVAMLVCLLAGNYLVRVIEWPLDRAPARHAGRTRVINVTLGTNQLGVFHLNTNSELTSILGTNPYSTLEIVPTMVGTNRVLGFKVRNDPQAAGGRKLPIEIINLSPAGAFIIATKVAFYGGLVVAAPLILYFVLEFVFPALKMRERKYFYKGLVFSCGLFLLGISFCYFVLMPVALSASAQYATWLGFSTTQWRAEDYIGFVCKFMLGMGLGFEMPVVILTLVKIGILDYKMLAGARRYVIVINVILGAILTTPEVITQILMAVPLQLLYEITVWIAWYWDRKEKKQRAEAGMTEV